MAVSPPGRRPGYTPRVVAAINAQHDQPSQTKTPGLPSSAVDTKLSRPGRVPGATNDIFENGPSIDATDDRLDVDNGSEDEAFIGQSRTAVSLRPG